VKQKKASRFWPPHGAVKLPGGGFFESGGSSKKQCLDNNPEEAQSLCRFAEPLGSGGFSFDSLPLGACGQRCSGVSVSGIAEQLLFYISCLKVQAHIVDFTELCLTIQLCPALYQARPSLAMSAESKSTISLQETHRRASEKRLNASPPNAWPRFVCSHPLGN